MDKNTTDIGLIKVTTDAIIAQAGKVVIGSEDVCEKMLAAMLAGGHVLLEDRPGCGKTTLAKTLAKLMQADGRRVQFTPDLMPSDITGLNIYNQKDGEFHLIKGPVFTNILLADEINRATPRTQASLLEAMEEKQVTIDGETLALADPFFVIATENPIETTGTYPLPEAQIDRFLMKLSMGTLSEQAELLVLEACLDGRTDQTFEPVCTAEEVCRMQQAVKTVRVHPCIREYIVHIAGRTRDSKHAAQGASTRATLALMRASQSFAAMQGRDYVIPDDVKALAIPVLAHRLATYAGGNSRAGEKIVQEILDTEPVPVEDWKQ